MASGMLFDPMRLLRLAPLISSTGSVMYSTCELIMNSAFLHPTIRREADVVLPRWFNTVFQSGVAVVVGLITITSSTSIANIYLSYNNDLSITEGIMALPFSAKMYALGVTCALGHLTFIPWVAPPIERLRTNTSKRGGSAEMEDWLSVHRIRWAVADFPAWVAIFLAVLTFEGTL
ncbi:TPA_exp: putative Integral membrane protein [Trichophyton benhamiae CBS 112371]|nr:TPA_exp: putative Integral membrane protein [Trichophyton benhamiae CBS 112371]